MKEKIKAVLREARITCTIRKMVGDKLAPYELMCEEDIDLIAKRIVEALEE